MGYKEKFPKVFDRKPSAKYLKRLERQEEKKIYGNKKSKNIKLDETCWTPLINCGKEILKFIKDVIILYISLFIYQSCLETQDTTMKSDCESSYEDEITEIRVIESDNRPKPKGILKTIDAENQSVSSSKRGVRFSGKDIKVQKETKKLRTQSKTVTKFERWRRNFDREVSLKRKAKRKADCRNKPCSTCLQMLKNGIISVLWRIRVLFRRACNCCVEGQQCCTF